MSFSGLHSLVEICVSGIISCEGMYLVSLFYASEKLAFIMLYRMYVVFWYSSLLGGRCYIQLHLGCLVGIILFEASIYCILCCWINSIGTRRFGIFW